MRKTLIYLVILAVLGAGVYYFLFSNRADSFNTAEAGFTIKDTASIGKIFLSGPNGSSVLLERNDSGWTVNKQYKALRGMTKMLLSTLSQQSALYPAPESSRNNVIKNMAGISVKVEVYDKTGNKMRVFYVGNEAYDYKGTYMLMEGANNPYVVQAPNFKGYLTPSYPYRLKDWRDRSVFNLTPEQVKRVSVQYVQTPVNSFVEEQNGGKLAVTTEPSVMANNKLNERRAHAYLKFFQNVNCEGYEVNNDYADSIIHYGIAPKFCVVDVDGSQGQHQHVEVFYMPLNKRSKNKSLPAESAADSNKYDADRYYAVINNGKDTTVIQNYVFEKIFRRGYEFYQPDQELPQVPQETDRRKLMPKPPQYIPQIKSK